MKKILAVVQAIDKYTHLIVGFAAAGIATVDPTVLPPKVAAAIILISQALVVANNWLSKVEAVVPEIVTPDPVVVVPPVVHDPNATNAPSPQPAGPNG